jgi:hypothetical protein
MCPVTPIEFASLFDMEVGSDGRLYIATYVDGCLSWVCSDDEEGFSSSSAKPKQRKPKNKSTNKYPSISLDSVSVNEVHMGEDGNTYVARKGKGGMHWSLHTKNQAWTTCEVTYLTFNNDDLSHCVGTSEKHGGKKNKKSSKRT